MKVTAIVDLQFGSTGKGLLAGYLSTKRPFDMVVSANMPNAGHTYVEPDGFARVHKVLPSGIYSKEMKFIGIGPGAVFDVNRLIFEVVAIRERGITAHILIHAQAGVLKPEHRETEQNSLSHISSTMQGSMEALVEKMRRGPGANTADNLPDDIGAELERMGVYVVANAEWMRVLSSCENVLVEGSQGYSLGISAGFYPYCTSRDCTVWRLLADCAVPVNPRNMEVIGSARMHPIRVGNTPDGYSGGCYNDQIELLWEFVGVAPELTTVTKRERRVFSFSVEQIRQAVTANCVDSIFLNFCNYDPGLLPVLIQRIDEATVLNSEYAKTMNMPSYMRMPSLVRFLGFGPAGHHVMDLHPEYTDGLKAVPGTDASEGPF